MCHVAKFEALEEMMTTWEPGTGQHSPDALDALVHAATDLLGLMKNTVDRTVNYKGFAEVSKAVIEAQRGPGPNLAMLIGGDTGGRI